MFTFEDYQIPALDRGVRLPDFIINQADKDRLMLEDDVSHAHFLFVLATEGLRNRGITTNHLRYKEYVERMKSELATLDELGFSSYLLLTWDIIRWCRENDVAIGRGRGSCAGSLVLYLIGVTEVDSLEHELYFERFLSKTRAKWKEYDGVRHYEGSLLMDIDLDIAHNQRNRVVKYVEEKYAGSVSKILTVSTFTTKVLVKEVAKAVIDDFQEKDAKLISDLIPTIHGKVYSIEKTLEESTGFKEFMDKNPKVLRVCRKLYGLTKHLGLHASAWAISSGPLSNIIPTQRAIEKESGLPVKVTAYDMSDTTNLVIKIDLLGLEAVTLINEVCKKIGNLKPFDIPVHDQIIYNTLKDFKYSYGIFQLADGCAKQCVIKVKPRDLNELSCVLALSRPGAMDYISRFADYTTKGEIQSLHPFLDPILSSTANIPLFQENLLTCLKKIGFSSEEAEIVRRIVGKKEVEAVKNWESKIYERCKLNNVPEGVAKILWDLLNSSASYAFNKSHSASYAMLSASTVYIQQKYPKQYFLTCLEMAKTTDDFHSIQSEAKAFNLRISGPSISQASMEFSEKDGVIYFGLSRIKGISDQSIEKLIRFRREFTNKFDIFSAAKSSKIGLGILANLIYAGCLDEYLTETRSKIVLEACCWGILTDRERVECLKRGAEFNFDLFKLVKALNKDIKNDKGKQVIKDSRRQTLLRDIEPYLKIYKNNIKHEKYTVHFMETLLLGFSYSFSLKDVWDEVADDLEDIETVKSHLAKEKVHFVGKVKFASEGLTKKASLPYLRVVVEDHTSEITCFLYESEKTQQVSAHKELNGRITKEGDVVIVRGQRSGDDIVNAYTISIQEVKVFAKVSEVKDDLRANLDAARDTVDLAPKTE